MRIVSGNFLQRAWSWAAKSPECDRNGVSCSACSGLWEECWSGTVGLNDLMDNADDRYR